MTRLVFLALLPLLALQFARAQDTAHIFVYAQQETNMRSWLPISCDGVPVAKIKRGNYFAINVPPGRHVLSAKKGVPAFVEIKSGDDSFIRLGSQVEVGEPATLVLGKVHPDVARQEMRFLSYIDARQVLAPSVPAKDPRPHPESHLKTRRAS